MRRASLEVLGADPEIFLKDIQTGAFVSAHTLENIVRGTKERPEKVSCGAIQIDGTALEININPTNCEEEWVHNLSEVLSALEQRLPEGLYFSDSVTAIFEPTYFRAGIPPEAKAIGCDPDFEYSTRDGERPRFFQAPPGPRRSAGGHIHVSHAHPWYTIRLDQYVGMGALTFDTDKYRNRSYGGPSAYRNKPYGLEYRTPSNAWLFSEERQRWAFRMTQAALVAPTPSEETHLKICRAIRTATLDPTLLPEDFEYVR